MLTSVQFLGLASQLANWFVTQPIKLSPSEAQFVRTTSEVVTEHLLRWGNERERSIISRLGASPKDVKGGSSDLFYTDKDLWMLSIHADLAGILESAFGRRELASIRNPRQLTLLKRQARLLTQFFTKRITLEKVKSSNGTTVIAADLDRGFWRLFADNLYAGYTSAAKPVVCEKEQNGGLRQKVLIPQQTVTAVDSLGWDISHARRLVHALDSLSRNRTAMISLYSIPESDMPKGNIIEAFANKLALSVWNGDRKYPLFTNYWNGANGWYRVAYDTGTGGCREGTPPYGLSISFPTGGYVSWGLDVPVLGELGRDLYSLFSRSDAEARRFVETYYTPFSANASKSSREMNEIMFLPTLVMD
jgi:hypothetical protein